MKQVKVSTPYFDDAEYLLLETEDDIQTYWDSLNDKLQETCGRLLRSDVKPDRWDHMLHRNDEGGVMVAGLIAAKLNGTNPIREAGSLAYQKFDNISRDIRNGEQILLNENGGYCRFDEGYHTITESEEYIETKPDTVTIKENTRYINLENDPDLEQHTINYLGSIDPNYSYITRLRNYTVDELVDIFNRFADNGGTTAYIYTTGIDIPQMYDYSTAIIKSRIRKVEFEFNAGQNEEHDKVIAFLREAQVEVNIL